MRTQNEIKSMITLLNVELNRLTNDSWAEGQPSTQRKTARIKKSIEILEERQLAQNIYNWLDAPNSIVTVKDIIGE